MRRAIHGLSAYKRGLVVCVVAVCSGLLLTATAQAAPTRNFDTTLTGLTPPSAKVQGPFVYPFGVAIGAADSVWITDFDPSTNTTSGFDPLGGFLSQLTNIQSRSLTADRSTGEIYVDNSAENGPKAISVYSSSGSLLRYIALGNPGGEIRIAIDNSGGAGHPGEGEQGRLYLAYEGALSALHPNGSPVDFSASEPYIPTNEHGEDENKITGTPAGKFTGSNAPVATDSHGDVYIFLQVEGETSPALYEFAPSGTFIREFPEAKVPGGFGNISGIAVDPTNGHVLLSSAFPAAIYEFDETANFLQKITGTSESNPFEDLSGIAVNSAGYLYVVEGEFSNGKLVDIFLPLGLGPLPEATTETTEIQRTSTTLHGEAKLGGGTNITKCQFEYVAGAEYEPWADHPYTKGATAPCLNSSGEPVGTESKPIVSTTELHAHITGIRAGTTYHYRLALTNGDDVPRFSADAHFDTLPAVTELKTTTATNITQKSATLTGSFTGEAGIQTEYFFEYGTSPNFGHETPVVVVPGPSAPTETKNVSSTVTEPELSPHTTYYYRIIAHNSFGTTRGETREFTTNQPPTIDGFSAAEVTATTAVLHAHIDPNGFPTRYHFEYGATTAYGANSPLPEEEEAIEIKEELASVHSVKVEITGLQPGVTYHFRVVAHNEWGSVTSEDQSFEFFPPSCPNTAVRQQTGSSYLPDCRAYELVSPSNANGTLLYPGGPNTGQATSPSRFSFTGAFSSLPATNPIGTIGDLYVATRTDTGWVSRYIGSPGDELACVGASPNEPWSRIFTSPVKAQDLVPTDPAMSRFLDFNDGAPATCRGSHSGTGDATEVLDSPSNVAYMWSADGSLLGKLPTNLAAVPDAAAALDCPAETPKGATPCFSAVAPSGDLTHFVFSSNRLAFAEGGLTEAPGSAYDDNLATGTVTLISRLSGGAPIPQDPTFASAPADPENARPGGKEEFIRFPAVSTDGSHILMSTATAATPACDNEQVPPPCQRFTDTPVHLYMSVNDLLTYEIAENPTTHEPAAVNYLGMTPDGSKVYFTSEEHLTEGVPNEENPGHGGTSLYMWSQEGEEQGHPLTLISKAAPGSQAGAGDTANCSSAWTSKCGVVPYSGWAYAQAPGGRGGNSVSDSALAANGDIYFFSPEQLDGDRGVLNQENLYDYSQAEGRVRFVATFVPETTCLPSGLSGQRACSAGPIARIEVNPTDTHMAFVTPDQLTSYDNTDTQGSCQDNLIGEPTGETHCTEMYSYTPATGQIVCDSCNPEGRPPTSDVYASQDGLFMTNDGRTFFSTEEALVPQDTNAGPDVYEFVDGRPRLITPGTGTASFGGFNLSAPDQRPGLVGVSANGTDVYFSTFDALTAEDHNGDFLKFYDARTDGGFPQPPPPQPCDAAEECHGPTAEAPTLPAPGTAAVLTGGNAGPALRARHHKKKHHKRATHKRHARRVNANRGGSK